MQMKLRKNLLKSASIIGYIMAVLHVFLAAWFFATEPYNASAGILSSTVSYILVGVFMCAMLGCLYTGFYFMDYKNKPREKESVLFWVCFALRNGMKGENDGSNRCVCKPKRRCR